jgi:hypothetical protein
MSGPPLAWPAQRNMDKRVKRAKPVEVRSMEGLGGAFILRPNASWEARP